MPSRPLSTEQSTVPFALDPFVVPVATASSGTPPQRKRAIFRGDVQAVRGAQWAGGPTLEVDLDDGTGPIQLAFLGRVGIAGITIGVEMVVAGMVSRRRRRRAPSLMNPQYWLLVRGA